MKLFKPMLLSVSIGVAIGMTGCTVTSHSKNEAIRSVQNIKKIKSAEKAEIQRKLEASKVVGEISYVRTVEGIEEYSLNNGLKVLLFEDASQPKTLVNVTYKVGSVHENYGETGMAHLLEHMLFKGSTHFPKIDTEFKKRGMATNATTWLDRTNYFEVFDANEESLDWAIGMEADRMINATFNEEQLKSEMTVVRNEMERNENSPTRMLLSRMFSLSFLWHNYGNSTIGARSDVENFPFSRLREFYKTHYRPDNAVLTIAGRFDKEKTLAIIEKKFGSVAQPEEPIQALYTSEPTQDGERIVNLRRVGDIPYVGVSYHIPSGLHPDAAAFSLLEEILGDYTRGRLQKNLVEAGFATGASNFSFLLKDSSEFIFIAQGDKETDLVKMESKLLDIAENLESSPITEEELHRAKLTLAKQSEQSMRNVTGIGMDLSEYIAKGDYRYNFYFRDLVADTTLEQVQAVAEKYLIQSNRTIGRFIPTEKPARAEIPVAPDLTEVLKDYKGKAVLSAGEVFDNNVANIKERLVQLNWKEGTKVNIYPKQLRGDEIIITMTFDAGNKDSLNGEGTAIDLVGSLIKLGNKNITKEQIATRLDELKSSVRISSSAGAFYVDITTDKTNLDETVKFLGELLAAPTFPTKELDVIKRSSVASVEGQRNDPRAIASNSFRKALYNYPEGHPKAYLDLDAKIAEINNVKSEDLARLYKELFSINNGNITVVGNVEPERISTALHTVLAPYSQDTQYEYMPMSLNEAKGLNVKIETPDKANAQLFVINPLSMTKSHKDYLALSIANTIFGGDAFTSRLGARIRVKEGYSYSVGSGLQVSSEDKQGLFYSLAIAAPENMESVVKALNEEVSKVVESGFTQEELDQAISGYLSNRTRSWANDSAVAGVINDASRNDIDLAYYQDQLDNVQKLTLDDINQAFNKYIASLEFNVFMAGDFAKVK